VSYRFHTFGLLSLQSGFYKKCLKTTAASVKPEFLLIFRIANTLLPK